MSVHESKLDANDPQSVELCPVPSQFGHVEEPRHIQRGLKSRHAQLIAIGGAIGTSLFVGTGQMLAVGGPGFLLLAFCILCLMIVAIITALTEVACYLPIHGGTMSYYTSRYASESMGFALGYLYWYSLGILVPYEVTAASLIVDYWNTDIPIAVLITVMIALIVILNLLPVSAYGETEFWFVSLKIILILGLIITSLVLCFGGGPSQDGMLGFRYWNNPGAVRTYVVDGSAGRFVAFLQTMVLASFAFVLAPEQLIITAGEMRHPRKNLPRAANTYFLRLVVFYVLGVICIGIVAPSDDARLTNGSAGAGSSPFVVGISNAGIRVLPSIVNAGILSSAWSAGNAFLYASSRSLYSLAVAGNAPQIFLRCNRWGVPYVAVGVSALFSLLSYLNVSNSSSVVFNWLVNITNTSGFISWICCMICFFRFRAAAREKGVELPYTSMIQPYGAWASLGMSILLLLLNGFTVFLPDRWSAASFLTAYIGIPAFLVLYLGHQFAHKDRPWLKKTEDLDLVSGLDEVETAQDV
ncbi:hypothetical protein OPT61_g5116 [Boeremia exigua]|uniref:Uncharacterized protein n=1 Tax=Boeremia exigua TaxID=749465 RepID=A0ACC2IBM0_9PLEO|nr:hypothetical protein OPT61_g5116 [Boeremia exigua]